MKLKFYMRGIGIGMLVTAAILKLSNFSNGSEMTDEQVRARAKELGMIENTVLKTASDNEIDVLDENIADNTEVIDLSTSTNVVISPNKGDNPSTNAIEVDDTTDDSANVISNNKADDSNTSDNKENKDKQDADTKTELKADDKDKNNDNTESQKDLENIKDLNSSSSNNAKPETTDGFITISVVKGDSSFSVAKKVVAAGLASSAADLDQFLCEHNYDKTLSVGNHKIPANATFDQIGKILTSKEN